MSIIRNIKDFRRFKQILLVLFEEGFGYLLDKVNLSGHVPILRRVSLMSVKKPMLTNPQRLRRAFERLGPTFVKFGQVLSLRPDFVPKEYIHEFEKMQDKVPSFSYDDVKQILKEEFGKPITKIFKSFSKTPIASASISQVHKAVLNNGKVVAVKVQRPNIREIMETDIDIMFRIAHLLEKRVKGIGKYKPVKIIDEFSRWTHRELDFKLEARNGERFKTNFKRDKSVYIPKIYNEYTTGKILTLEFIDAIELNDISTLKKKRINVNKIIQIGLNAILTQVFIHGFFHADPHPGNIFILKKEKVAFIDYGIVGYFNKELRDKSIKLFLGIVNNDIEQIVDTFSGMGMVVDGKNDLSIFKNQIQGVLQPMENMSLKELKISKVLDEVLDIALDHNVKMPIDFILFGKTIATLEGVGLRYDPDFKFVKNAEPVIKKLMKKELKPKKIMKGAIKTAGEYKYLLATLPKETLEIIKNIKEGSIKVDLEDADLRGLRLEMERSSGNLAVGMIIAALIVGSALVMEFGDPVLLGFPVPSFVGFLFALLLGFWLVHRTVYVKLKR